MVETRTRTASLPAKQATLADEQAVAARVKPLKSAIKVRKTTTTARAKKVGQSVELIETTDHAISDQIAADSSPREQTAAPLKKKAVKKTSAPPKKGSKQARGKQQSSSPEATASHSQHVEGGTSFLDLPPELRNEIYSYVVIDDDLILISTTKMPYVAEPALLAVNRQVRCETLGLFYSENSFFIEGSSMANKFLRSLDEERLQALRSLRIGTSIQQPTKAIIARLQHLFRAFKSTGLHRSTLKMEVSLRPSNEEWMSLPDILRAEDAEDD